MRKRNTPTGGAIDPDPESFKYSLDEFLTSGHDDHGQSVRLFFRCPPALERVLEVLRDSHRFPYSTIPDIIRHGVIRHAEWLHRLEPDMPRHFLSGLHAIDEVCRDTEMLTKLQQTFAKVDRMVESALVRGDNTEAQRLLSVCRSQMLKLPESRWKRDFLEQFARKYARYLPTSANHRAEDASSAGLRATPGLSAPISDAVTAESPDDLDPDTNGALYPPEEN